MKIENQKLNIKESFKNFYYVVPAYQRDYVWTLKNVEQLLNDIKDEFQNGSDSEYFIGSTVVNKSGDNNTYEIIDGQQRLTTLFLCLCAFRNLFDAESSLQELFLNAKGLLSADDIDKKGIPITKPRLALQYEDSYETLQNLLQGREMPINLVGASLRIKAAFDDVSEYLTANFKSQDDLRKFYGYFTNMVSFIQIETPSINDSLKIFETINERGIGLDAMDLLKNLLFRQLKREEFNKIHGEWKTIRDSLDKGKIKPLRFLRYFIMANYSIGDLKKAEVIYEDEIYKWIVSNDNQVGYTKQPLDFVKKLKDSATAYTRFSKGEDSNGKSDSLQNMMSLGGAAFSLHYIILLAAKGLNLTLFNHLVRQIESVVFYYTVTKTSTKELESKFSKWAKKVKAISELGRYESVKNRLNEFIVDELEPEIRNLENDFQVQFLNLSTKSLQGYKIKYILSKIAAYIEAQRIGDKGNVSIQSFLKARNEMEHILPQKPTQELLSTYENQEQYYRCKFRLGNLTLLEKPINIVAGREFFQTKLKLYKNSKFYMTKSIAEKEQVGVNTSITRINQDLISFSEWNEQSIARRQEMLFNLAKKIWRVETLP